MLHHVFLGLQVALAWFFALSACAALCFFAARPLMRRWLRREHGAIAPLALRVAPAGAAIGCVAGLVVPAFVWLEPIGSAANGERLGATGLALATSGATLLLASLVRGTRAVLRTRRHMRALYAVGTSPADVCATASLFVTESAAAYVVLDGLIRPRLVVSRSVAEVLTPEELDRAVAHELAHHRAHDNLKRRLLAFAPDLIAGSRQARELERDWRRCAELEADAAATQGSEAHAIALASALVKVARLAGGRPPVDLGRAAFHGGAPVAERIRTLCDRTMTRRAAGRAPAITAAAAVTLVAGGLFHAPAVLTAVHRVTEAIVHLP